jgi:hypothetical protein
MAWSTIRKATNEDCEKLETRAEAFAKRHGIERGEIVTAVTSVENHIAWASENYEPEGPYLNKLWRAVVKRALDHPWAEGIAWGYVGFYVA